MIHIVVYMIHGYLLDSNESLGLTQYMMAYYSYKNGVILVLIHNGCEVTVIFNMYYMR